MSEKENKKETVSPWVPGAVARRVIGMLTLVTLIQAGVIASLSIAAIKIAKEPPKLVTNNLGSFVEAQIKPLKVSRDDVERFVQLVIPRLYAQSGGDSPGLEQIRTLVNPNILANQSAEMDQKSKQLAEKGITQFAIVNGINPQTMVIDRQKKTIYCEAIGLVGLTDKNGKARTVPTQWSMMMYLVDIIPTSDTSVNPGAELLGNERGIYLQQYAEQEPGKINEKMPKATNDDIAEYEEQQKERRQREDLIRLLRNNSANENSFKPAPVNEGDK
jgi:hypothetical protein